jgi:hypothetical protein
LSTARQCCGKGNRHETRIQPDNVAEMTKTTLSENARTHNERFGATAAGSANLKGSAGMPPLRQAAPSL